MGIFMMSGCESCQQGKLQLRLEQLELALLATVAYTALYTY